MAYYGAQDQRVGYGGLWDMRGLAPYKRSSLPRAPKAHFHLAGHPPDPKFAPDNLKMGHQYFAVH